MEWMPKNCQGIINLSENEYNISKLTNTRAIASIPIAGRYRVIDFVLSNMVNSDVSNVGIFTDYNFRSLMDHTSNGSPWDLDRKIDGMFIFTPNFNPATTSVPRGDMHHFYSNVDYIRYSRQEYVLVSCSYMIANVDFDGLYEKHVENGSDITLCYKKISNAHQDFKRCYVLDIGRTGRVLSAGTNMGHRPDANISMEMYIMKKEIFLDIVMDSISRGKSFYLNDAINESIKDLKVVGFEHKGYLKCINSVESYYEANMDLLNPEIAHEIFYSDRKIFTKAKDESPTFYGKNSKVRNSFIANGCVIDGEVNNSIIFRRVTVEKGAVVNNSIIMQNSIVRRDAKIDSLILDKAVTITEKMELKGDKRIPLVIDKRKII